MESLIHRFMDFAHGHFMSWEAIKQNYLAIAQARQPQVLPLHGNSAGPEGEQGAREETRKTKLQTRPVWAITNCA